jgi:hypothetical protein
LAKKKRKTMRWRELSRPNREEESSKWILSTYQNLFSEEHDTARET